jgi:hypothetical protein
MPRRHQRPAADASNAQDLQGTGYGKNESLNIIEYGRATHSTRSRRLLKNREMANPNFPEKFRNCGKGIEKGQKGRMPHAGGEQLKLGGLSVVGGGKISNMGRPFSPESGRPRMSNFPFSLWRSHALALRFVAEL